MKITLSFPENVTYQDIKDIAEAIRQGGFEVRVEQEGWTRTIIVWCG